MRASEIFRLGGVAVVTLALLLTVGGAYGGLVNPDSCMLPALLCLAFPYMLALTAVLVLTAFIWCRKMAVAGVVVLAACLPSILSVCPLNYGEKSADGHPVIKVMTYNVLQCHDYTTDVIPSSPINLTMQAILDADADVVLMQETFDNDLFTYDRSWLPKEQSAHLVERYPYRILPGDGLGILSKYPVKLVPMPYDDFGEKSFMLNRYEVDVNGRKVTMVNVHLQSLSLSDKSKQAVAQISRIKNTKRKDLSAMRHELVPKLTRAIRLRAPQARELRRLLDGIEGPLLVAGDFNDVPLCYAARTIAGDNLTDVYRSAAAWPAYTFRSRGMYFRIDHMMCGDGLEPLDAECVKAGFSDHYPILATIAITDSETNTTK